MSIAGPASGAQPTEESSSESPEFARPAKRTRVAVACTRCKSRKQKCDGGQPKCGNCKNLTIACEYIVPSKTIPHGKYQYIKSLEARVAELESLVSSAGLLDAGADTRDSTTQSSPLASHEGENVSRKQPEEKRIVEATQYLKDLSLHAGGGFVGEESSNITVGHIFGTMSQMDTSTMSQEHPRLGSRSLSGDSTTNKDLQSDPLTEVSPEIAEMLLTGYLKHISTRWVVLYRPYVLELHKKNTQGILVDNFEISTLNLVYAIGGRFLETVGEVGAFDPDHFYQASLGYLDSVLQASDVSSIQTLLLHAIYCLRAPRGLSAWTNVGLATRICASLGLHRKTVSRKPTLALEVRKRVFWSCYCLDRQVSIILGRPFAISDRDIDAELPLDVPDILGDAEIQALPSPDPNKRSIPSTSLSCFVHIIRLRRIESRIQQSIYRVDKINSLSRAKVDKFLAMLDEWRSQLPPAFAESDTEAYSYDGIWYYDVYYYKCLRLLLYPQLSTPIVDSDLVVRCADACGGVCRSYKWLHRDTKVGFSLMAIYSIFLAGLTLLYCLWMSPATIYTTATMNDLNSCSIVLYVIAERWPGAKRYRDAFESIKQNVLGLLEKGQEAGQKMPLPGLANRGLRDIGSQGLYPEAGREYSQMMNDMVGMRQTTPASLPSPVIQSRPTRSVSISSQVSAEAPAATMPAAPEMRFQAHYQPQQYTERPYFYEEQFAAPMAYNDPSQTGFGTAAERQGSMEYGPSGMGFPGGVQQQFHGGEAGPPAGSANVNLPADFDPSQYMSSGNFVPR